MIIRLARAKASSKLSRSIASAAIQRSRRPAIKIANPASSKLARAQERRDTSLPISSTPPPTTKDPVPESASAGAVTPVPAPIEDDEFIITPPAIIPHDQHGIIDALHSEDAVRELLSVNAIVVARQLEMMNILLGYEEANKYQLLNPAGEVVGYLMEEELGIVSSIKRQVLRTHRAMKATVLDTAGKPILVVRRPFSYINSRIYVSLPGASGAEEDEVVIGEAQQEWNIYRRKYNYFLKRDGEMDQFGSTDSGFLAWDFDIANEKEEIIGSINRNFGGFGREIFTDTGKYVLRFDVSPQVPAIEGPTSALLPSPSTVPTTTPSDPLPSPSDSTSTDQSLIPTSIAAASTPSETSGEVQDPPLSAVTLDQRAVMLAASISIDFDYFTRSRQGIGGFMPMWIPGMGGGSTEAGGAGAEGAEGAEGGDVGPTAGGGLGGDGDGDLRGWDSGRDTGGDYTGRDGGGVGENTNNDSGGWSEGGGGGDAGETMSDPWASGESSGGGEDGGTWSWGDLFPDE